MDKDEHLSQRDKVNNAFEKAFDIHAVPESLKKEAKSWSFIKREVSDIMTKKVFGRVQPIIHSIGGNSRPIYMEKHMSPFIGCYPKWVDTDTDKLKYLNEQLDSEDMRMDIYLELVSVLKGIKNKDIRQTGTDSVSFEWCL